MFGRFLPKEAVFFDFFEQHAKLVHQAAKVLLDCMLADSTGLNEFANPVKEMEHEADQIAYRCIDTLHKCFITPLQHNDIFALIKSMDNIIDAIDEVYDNILVYKISDFTPISKEMGQLLLSATENLEMMVQGLRNRKEKSSAMREASRQIHKIEHLMDEKLRIAMGALFEQEENIRLLIKWKDIYAGLEIAVDDCQSVSNIIEGIILEYD